jgi:hypothetical protein
MNPARPLRDIFADPVDGSSGADAAGPAEVLRAAGHPDLPDSLVAEAVGSYADTAPIEVAEHLSPYVMAHSPIPLPDQAEVESGQWLEAVSTAPSVAAEGYDPLLGLDGPPVGLDAADHYTSPANELGDVIDFGQTGPDDSLTPTADPGPDTGGESVGYYPPEDPTAADILPADDDIHPLDAPTDPDDALDTWDDA